jgi:acyl carrier protein
MDDQIKIRGYRIEPNEIVVVLNRHPEVQSSVVIARSDLSEEKRLVAYIVPAAAAQPTVGALRDWLAASVPPYMLPDVFVGLGAFPLTAHGKIDLSALPAPTDANALRDEVYESPRTPVEERVAAILASLVGLERLGINDNFFLLGGHSLLGTQAIAKLRDAFGVDVSLRTLFTAPTVSGLSAEVERLLLERVDAMSDEDVRRTLDV